MNKVEKKFSPFPEKQELRVGQIVQLVLDGEWVLITAVPPGAAMGRRLSDGTPVHNLDTRLVVHPPEGTVIQITLGAP